MKNKRVIVWFRNDLRVHDNEALVDALETAEMVFPVYIFDERTFGGKTKYGFRKTDIFRTQFIIESIKDLRANLQNLGSNLIVRVGKPEDIITELAQELKTSWVFCNRERTHEELNVQDTMERNLWTIGQELRYSRGKMLYYTADLPFPITHTPDVFTQYKKEVEKIVPVRPPLCTPLTVHTELGNLEAGPIPNLEDFGYGSEDQKRLKGQILQGGETNGLNRLKDYIWTYDQIAQYKDTRNEMIGLDYSSKFSSYLSTGCLSPKLIYEEIKKYEKTRKKNDSTYHLVFELLWRDFFRLMGKKHGNTLFKKGGIKREKRHDLKDDMSLFKIWAEARTGIPFIDAAMREIKATGYMSNRARQNVASFLVNDLHINWQIGAEYFESLLIDYDPCSNWGNWNYIAGVGNDPRENRHFNIILQARRYDPDGAFVKHWIPELSQVPSEYVHQPHLMSQEEQKEYGVILAKHYPNPCVRLED
jgi:deoxyribodipyrimidine photo-lyase